MIKGISRQIIEVGDTGSEYFERAMLFVSPCFSDAERSVLEKEAKRLLRQMNAPSQMKCKRKRIYLTGRMMISCLIGAAIGVICCLSF